MILRHAQLAVHNSGRALRWARRQLRRNTRWSWRDVSDAAVALESSKPEAALALHQGLWLASGEDDLLAHRLGLALAASGNVEEAMGHLYGAVERRPDIAAYWQAWLGCAAQVLPAERLAERLDAAPRATGSASSPAARAAAAAFLAGKRVDLADSHARTAFGVHCAGLSVDDSDQGVYAVRLRFEGGRYRITFTRDFLYWPFLVGRLITLAGFLDRFAASYPSTGALRLSVGDGPDGGEPQVCFSADDPRHTLIPDPIFLETQGYRSFQNDISSLLKPWGRRREQAYWRGSLTGMAVTIDEAMALPRVKLAQLSRSQPGLDARVTDLSQFGPLLPELQFRMEGLGLLGPVESALENIHYKFLIDVDGNTNSWPGLFMKLACGGLVIKLRSAFRQWYYPRLEDGRHYIGIDRLEDMFEVMDEAKRTPERAERIARAGQALASSMTPHTEYEVFAASLRSALNGPRN